MELSILCAQEVCVLIYNKNQNRFTQYVSDGFNIEKALATISGEGKKKVKKLSNHNYD